MMRAAVHRTPVHQALAVGVGAKCGGTMRPFFGGSRSKKGHNLPTNTRWLWPEPRTLPSTWIESITLEGVDTKPSRFTEEQIVGIMPAREASEGGGSVPRACGQQRDLLRGESQVRRSRRGRMPSGWRLWRTRATSWRSCWRTRNWTRRCSRRSRQKRNGGTCRQARGRGPPACRVRSERAAGVFRCGDGSRVGQHSRLYSHRSPMLATFCRWGWLQRRQAALGRSAISACGLRGQHSRNATEGTLRYAQDSTPRPVVSPSRQGSNIQPGVSIHRWN